MIKETGRALGGRARAEAMTPKERKALAKKAAAARWSVEVKEVTHGSEDHPLTIGDIKIPCYVLDDETRVLSQRGLQTGIGMSISGGSSGEQRMAGFIDGLAQKGIDTKDLPSRIRNPIRFKLPAGGRSFGFEATILADICDVVLAARKAGALQHQQQHIADQCEILMRGFARVGIIALVDEATGFQKDRARDALAEILEQFIANELRPYIKTFPVDFYEHMFRLRNLEYPKEGARRPQYFGHLTNDVIYARLAPGVLDELRKVAPRREDGRRKHPFTRWLTEDVGHPKLREHLASVVTIMKLSDEYDDFEMKLDRIHPRYDRTIPLPLLDKKGKPV